MTEYNIDTFSLDDANQFIQQSVEAVLVVDAQSNRVKPLLRKGIFSDFIKDDWTYNDLIEKFWYHFNNSSESIVEDYLVFLPSSGIFRGKYSRRVNLVINEIIHVVQMMVYPLTDDFYVFILDELDKSSYREEDLTNKKVDTIQNMYLFSMYIDIVKDETSSISVTEISDEVVNQQLKYTDWRMMIVNMISQEYQQQFLEETDPENLKKRYSPGRTSSFDCLMMNLEGKYIWVKLIFRRAETNNDNDYRFVFMVQNIHDELMEMRETLKEYEMRASVDSLTSVYNHGRIETELNNAVVECGKNDTKVSAMMIDIDYFKRVNDQYGHSTGDVTLKHFAKCLQEALKEKNAVLGRWGGEEFTAVCYDLGIEEATELAESMRRRIEAEEFEKVGKITCSIGVTQIKAEDQFDNAFERMDKAVYQAKSDGRNCVRVK